MRLRVIGTEDALQMLDRGFKRVNDRAAVHEEPVQVRLEAEPVAVALGSKEVPAVVNSVELIGIEP